MLVLNFDLFFDIMNMKEEKFKKLELLRAKASELKKDVDYYNALQLSLKLILNGSYF
jgi:hypothetical protein